MDDWFSVDISDPGTDYWNMEPIQQTWDTSYDYSYDPSYDYSYDYSYDPSYDPSYDYNYNDQGLYGPMELGGNLDESLPSGYYPGYKGGYDYNNPAFDSRNYDSVDSGTDGYGGETGVDYSQPQYGDYSGGQQAGPPNPYSTGTGGQPGQPQQSGQPQQPGQQSGQPRQPGQPQQSGQQSGGLLGGLFGGGSSSGSGGGMMDSLLPMLLAGGAGYLLSTLIGNKSGGGSAPGGSIGAFGVNQAALSPTTPLNVPTQGTRTGLQPAWGTAGAPSAESLGFRAPGTVSAPTPLALPYSGFNTSMSTNQYPMTVPQLPSTQLANTNIAPNPADPSKIITKASIGAAPLQVGAPVAPLDINNVNFGNAPVAGYTPPAGAPVAPNQINDFLKSLMGQ